MIKIITPNSNCLNTLQKVKYNFLFLICLLGFSFSGFSQSIQVTSVVSNPACGGETVTVTFNTTNGNGPSRHYSNTTNFVAYLSTNLAGAPYTLLGNLTMLPYTFVGGNGAVNTNVQGTITLPVSAAGTYKISVGSTSPFFIASSGNGASPNFTVNAAPNGGTLAGGATVCPGINNTVLTLSGHGGSIVKWQSSPVSNFSSSVTDIANTTTSLNVINISTTTYYRVVLTNGTCTANSTVAGIIVDPNPGTVSSDQSICSGTQPANIILSGSTGTIQWQRSSDNVVFSNINGATATILTSAQMGVLTSTTYYRAVVTGGCGVVNSSVVTVTVSPATVGGTVLSDASVCSGNNSTVLTLTGYTGSIIKWQSSTMQSFNSPVDIANTTNTLTVTNIMTTTYYRAVVQSGNCTVVNSSQVKLTVLNSPNGGTLSGSTTVCYGTNSTVLTVAGHTNNSIQKWQSSPVSDFSFGVLDIANTATTLTVTNLTATTHYRVVVANMNCTAYSTTATITVNPMLTASIVSNNGPICSGSNAVFNVSGSSGATLTYSINGGANQTIVLTGGVGVITVVGAIGNQTLTLVSVSLGVCSQVLSGTSTVVVNSSNVWTGAVDNQWGTAGNWSCGTLPTAATDVTINSGTVIVSGVNAFANTLVLNGTTMLTVNSGNNITVTDAVTVASGANMTLQNNANLIQINNVSNSGNIVVNRKSSALMRLDYTLWSSPVASQNLLAFSPLTVATRFYVYNSATNLYSTVTPSSTNFQLGKGYLIRMPDNHPTSPTKWDGVFTGVPNNGNVNFSAFNGGAGFGYNGVGNPYPSPVDMNLFVNGNAGNITGTLYFWRKTNSSTTEPGYCTWTTAGFVSNGEAQVVNPNGILRTGQGFIVEMSSGNNVSFTNAMRTADNADQFFRNSDATSNRELNGDRLWLNVSNSFGANNQMLLGYFANATLGVDYGIDGKAIEDAPVSLTMDIAGGNYLIQGRPSFDVSDSVPLRFKTSYSGAHTISIDHLDGVFLGSQNVYLKDNLLNITHDLKAAAYSFASDAGTFANRFEIVYQTSVLGTNQSNFSENTVVVFKDENGNLNVNANGITLDVVEVYDVQGRKLIQKSAINAASVLLSGLRTENNVLLIKVVAADGAVVNKKIVF